MKCGSLLNSNFDQLDGVLHLLEHFKRNKQRSYTIDNISANWFWHAQFMYFKLNKNTSILVTLCSQLPNGLYDDNKSNTD